MCRGKRGNGFVYIYLGKGVGVCGWVGKGRGGEVDEGVKATLTRHSSGGIKRASTAK